MKINEWNSNYRIAKRYYEQNHNLLVNSKYTIDGYNLGKWICRQRENYKKGILSEEKINKLNTIKMIWDVSEYEWDIMYNYAKKYYINNNNLLIHKKYTIDGYNLGEWIKTQRKNYKNHKIAEKRIEKLNDIGMVWDVYNSEWNKAYQYANKYYEENKNLNINCNYIIDNFPLGIWISNQRTQYKQKNHGTLSEDKIKKLEQIEMIWNYEVIQNENQWQKNYKEAKKFFDKNGHLKIPDNYIIDNFNLGKWILNQRTNYKNKKMTQEHILLLNKIGMLWEVNNHLWSLGYKYAEDYYKKNKNLLVDTYFVVNNFNLGTWIVTQRGKYKKNKLTTDQIYKLEKIGMIWNRNEFLWQQGFLYAKEYYKNNGNLNIKGDYIFNNYNLGSWIQTQKQSFKIGDLSKKREKLLNSIGIIWSVHDEMWQKGYDYAKTYYEKYHNLLVPNAYSINGFNLGAWIRNKRRLKNVLSYKQVEALENIGMIWNLKNSSASTSFPEQAIYYYLLQYFDDVINRYDDLGFELDIFIPSLNLAVEYDGSRWHKNTDKDIKKNQKCIKNNIKLIRIREYECPILNSTDIEIIRLDDKNNLETAIKELLLKLNISKINIDIERDKNIIYDSYIRSLDKAWRTGYSYAKEYYKENKNLLVPALYVNEKGYRLGQWISRCRKDYKIGRLSKEMISMLNNLEMIWDVFEYMWQEGFKYAKQYYNEHGNLLIPKQYEINGLKLGLWINVQRQSYKYNRNKISKEKIEMLNSIGMIWDYRSAKWEQGYNYAREYYQKNRNLLVPGKYMIDDFNLGEWILEQRQNYRKMNNPLFTQEKIEKLDAISMIWNCRELQWNLAYNYAKQYYLENKNLNIPVRYQINNFQLGQWMSRQKRNYKYKNNPLFTKEKEKMLEKIGIEWNC